MVCNGTSSIHTWKPVTCRACRARLWATLFPSLRTCENLIQWNKLEKHLTSWIGKPKAAKEWGSSFKAFITISESPSRMTLFELKSAAHCKAFDAVKVSSSTTIRGRGMITDHCAKPFPWQSQIITPIPALSSSWNIASKKFVLEPSTVASIVVLQNNTKPPPLFFLGALNIFSHLIFLNTIFSFTSSAHVLAINTTEGSFVHTVSASSVFVHGFPSPRQF